MSLQGNPAPIPPRTAISYDRSATAYNLPEGLPPDPAACIDNYTSNGNQLYEALAALEHEAGIYTNISQLRLALRGLESENPVTRIAILGVEDQAGAKRLARALLADPLAKQPPWEKELTDSDIHDERALLLRYGAQQNVVDRHPLVRTLFIPSTILNTHRLEVFVQTVHASTENPVDEASSLLVPSLETTSSPRGRLSIVTYPVHKSLVYANGFRYLASLTQVAINATREIEAHMVKGVVDGSWSGLEPGVGQSSAISPINLNLAEVAIETLRKSLQGSIEYEHAWFDSGLPTISAWLSEGTQPGPRTIQPSVHRLISVITTDVINAINSDEAAKSQDANQATVPAWTREILYQGVTIWAENAHTELRDRLAAAFISKSWKRIKWYKLFWGVDDVGAVLSEILQRAWLVDAEKEMIWISGRIHQSGLLGPPKLRPPAVKNPEDEEEEEEQKLGGEPKRLTVEDVIGRDIPPFDTEDGGAPLSLQPYLQIIALARRQLSHVTIPTLQSLAQSLVLQSISTTVLSMSVSALLYVSISATSVYEASVIAALGTVYSLRRLQTRWEKSRREWKATITEEGRRVLQLNEEQCRQIVTEGGYGKLDEVGIEERRIAREAIEKVREALGEVGR
ncbi:MAG: hypothetical protein Q9217_001511 [Psora testacea]